MDYKDTLNLPKTDFPMKAGLSEQEPLRVAKWDSEKLYDKLLSERAARGKYVLHDGPPYANGNIHLGHALNKILKDIVVKIKYGFGMVSPYIPGWDCHGLPIENRVDKELGDKKASMSVAEIRKLCRKYAAGWIDVQRNSFKRLGIIGDWHNPYITMDYAYEATTLGELYKVLKAGNVYKGFKPVYWCSTCVTALAEAEVEYADHVSTSVYVKFALTDEALKALDIAGSASAVIWTTTPWTLPANLGISAHPNEDYALMQVEDAASENLAKGELIIVAAPMLEGDLQKRLGVNEWSEVKRFPAKMLDRLTAKHPFLDRTSLFMLGDHVLMTDGTGLVHTAPGHGMEDYIIGQAYGLDTYNPVDDKGNFVRELPIYGGMNINKANDKIVADMKESGALIASSKINHSYPHCWRCKNPVIYRATPQWFISMSHNDLRGKALKAIENDVQWMPSWGANRIHSMIENRPDWCISRQRSWGVPIALFTCKDCGHIIINDDLEQKIIDSFKAEGADAWFEHDSEYFLGKDAACPKCSSKNINKETDILDVWFDSGTSHAAVCEARPEIGGKADLYLEGSDQHRGWFHSSLLESIATRGVAPYRQVLTHGFVVDGDLKKMSKSQGNVVSPDELISKYGAEIVRLWVAAEDYTGDIRISDDILKRLVESYRKVRNTARYMLGSLADFHPEQDSLPPEEMADLDRYILMRWQEVLEKIYAGYNGFQFHIFYHSLLNFCINDLSGFYLDIIKDRLYSYGAESKERRSGQTAIFKLIKEMTVVMAPVLSFTADEIWDYLPTWQGKKEFVFEEEFPSLEINKYTELMGKMEQLITVRRAVNKALELSRTQKVIGHPLDAAVTIGIKDEGMQSAILSLDEGLSRMLIVSSARIVPFDDIKDGVLNEEGNITVAVLASSAAKCERCWTRDDTTGHKHDGLCDRCAEVLGH